MGFADPEGLLAFVRSAVKDSGAVDIEMVDQNPTRLSFGRHCEGDSGSAFNKFSPHLVGNFASKDFMAGAYRGLRHTLASRAAWSSKSC